MKDKDKAPVSIIRKYGQWMLLPVLIILVFILLVLVVNRDSVRLPVVYSGF